MWAWAWCGIKTELDRTEFQVQMLNGKNLLDEFFKKKIAFGGVFTHIQCSGSPSSGSARMPPGKTRWKTGLLSGS